MGEGEWNEVGQLGCVSIKEVGEDGGIGPILEKVDCVLRGRPPSDGYTERQLHSRHNLADNVLAFGRRVKNLVPIKASSHDRS